MKITITCAAISATPFTVEVSDNVSNVIGANNPQLTSYFDDTVRTMLAKSINYSWVSEDNRGNSGTLYKSAAVVDKENA